MSFLSFRVQLIALKVFLALAVLTNTIMAQEIETQYYQVVKQINGAELRFYPPAMKIQSNNDFNSLFNYISGNNSTREKISMTSPVYMGDGNGSNVMAFVLPNDFNQKNTPDALSQEVKVFESEPGYFLALEFGGYASGRNVRYYADELSVIAQKYGLNTIGKISVLVYDSPYKVIGRRNEVIIQIDVESI